jgi:putative resolvase
MPVPARRLESGTIWVAAVQPESFGRAVIHARVSLQDQRSGLDRQVARLAQWATSNGHEVCGVVAGVGCGLNGKRPGLRRVLSDPAARVVVVEHRDRVARFGVEHLEGVLGSYGRRIVVADPGESTDDVVRDMIEVLPWMCARLSGRRGVRSRALRAVAARQEPGRHG